MELKYYLRGLGLGIIVTAIIMGAATSGKQTMTDAEIIARAKQLGMIEDKVLSESAAGKEDAPEEEGASGEGSASNKEGASGEGSASNKEGVSGEGSASNKEGTPKGDGVSGEGSALNEENASNEGNATGEAISGSDASSANETQEQTARPVSNIPMVITIGPGDGSYAVSKKLADVGAISSPESFDTFLCEHGYDKKIRTGTYTIPADASDEQMARIITGAE